MANPAPNLANHTIPQLLDALHAGMVGSPMHQHATFMLQYRLAEKQAEAAAQQAAAAEKMIGSTPDLANFTQGLARATWALFFVGGAPELLTVVRIILAVTRR